MKKLLALFLFLVPCILFASDLTPADLTTTWDQLIQTAIDLIANAKGSGTLVTISGIIYLVIAAMKNSFLYDHIWVKLENVKGLDLRLPFVYLLTLIATLIAVHPLTWANFGIAAISGVGAVMIDNLLGFVKTIPGISSTWATVVGFIQSIFGLLKKN